MTRCVTSCGRYEGYLCRARPDPLRRHTGPRNNTTSEHCVVWLNVPACYIQPKDSQPRERAQSGATRGRTSDVETFRMDVLGSFIIEKPHPLRSYDTATPPTKHKP